VIKSGKYKDAGSPFRDMTKEERELLQALIDDVHEQFVDAVSGSRTLDKEKVKEIATAASLRAVRLWDSSSSMNWAIWIMRRRWQPRWPSWTASPNSSIQRKSGALSGGT